MSRRANNLAETEMKPYIYIRISEEGQSGEKNVDNVYDYPSVFTKGQKYCGRYSCFGTIRNNP